MPDDHRICTSWADVIQKSGAYFGVGDGGVLRFTDATGDSIVEHAGGRFRFDSFRQRWLPDA